MLFDSMGIRSKTGGHSTNHVPDMDIPLSFRVLYRGKPDLSENDRSVRHGRATDLNEVPTDVEGEKVLVGHTVCARPHAGLVQVPVMARLQDLCLYGVFHNLKGLESVLFGRMGFIEGNRLVGGCS